MLYNGQTSETQSWLWPGLQSHLQKEVLQLGIPYAHTKNKHVSLHYHGSFWQIVL